MNSGARINQVQAESGATVTLDRDNESSGTALINIDGRPEQIANAKLLLQMWWEHPLVFSYCFLKCRKKYQKYCVDQNRLRSNLNSQNYNVLLL